MGVSLILLLSFFTIILVPSPFMSCVRAMTQSSLHETIMPNINNSTSTSNDGVRKQLDGKAKDRAGGSWSYGWGWGGKAGGGGGGGGGPAGGGGGGGMSGGPGGRGGGFGRGDGNYSNICWWQCIIGSNASSNSSNNNNNKGGGGMRSRRGKIGNRVRSRHSPSYSSSLYRVGEYAMCTEGRCRGMRLLCPMHCQGPCFYDCESNCKAHCRA